MTVTFVAFDTETTGLDPAAGDRVIEYAGLRYDLSGALLDKLVLRIDPECPINPKAQEVHGITYAQLVGKPKFADVAHSILANLNSGDFIVAHNAPFDLDFLAAEFALAGVAAKGVPVADTALARWATYNGKTPTLGELAFSLGIPYDPTKAHAAEYDVMVCAQCFIAGLKRGFFNLPGAL